MSTPPDHTTRTGAAGARTFALGETGGEPAGVRRHAPARRSRAAGPAAPRRGAGGAPGRHRRVLRSRDQRGVDRRGVVALPGRAGDRDQGPDPPTDRWGQQGNPGRLREAVEGSLRRLRLERIDLYQLARIDPTVPAADQFGVLAELRTGQDPPRGALRGRGRAGRGGAQARAGGLGAEPLQPRRPGLGAVVDHCEREGIAFLPWFPLGAGRLAEAGGALGRWRGATRPRRPRSPWPGCCGAPRSWCPSPAPPRWHTWRRTWPPRRCGSPTTRSGCWARCEQADAAVGRRTDGEPRHSRSGSDELRHLVASGRRDG